MRGKDFSCIIRKYYFYDCLLNKKFLGKGLQWVNINSSLHPPLLSLWSEAGGFCFSSPFISRPVSLSKKYQKLSKKKSFKTTMIMQPYSKIMIAYKSVRMYTTSIKQAGLTFGAAIRRRRAIT